MTLRFVKLELIIFKNKFKTWPIKLYYFLSKNTFFFHFEVNDSSVSPTKTFYFLFEISKIFFDCPRNFSIYLQLSLFFFLYDCPLQSSSLLFLVPGVLHHLIVFMHVFRNASTVQPIISSFQLRELFSSGNSSGWIIYNSMFILRGPRGDTIHYYFIINFERTASELTWFFVLFLISMT